MPTKCDPIAADVARLTAELNACQEAYQKAWYAYVNCPKGPVIAGGMPVPFVLQLLAKSQKLQKARDAKKVELDARRIEYLNCMNLPVPTPFTTGIKGTFQMILNKVTERLGDLSGPLVGKITFSEDRTQFTLYEINKMHFRAPTSGAHDGSDTTIPSFTGTVNGGVGWSLGADQVTASTVTTVTVSIGWGSKTITTTTKLTIPQLRTDRTIDTRNGPVSGERLYGSSFRLVGLGRLEGQYIDEGSGCAIIIDGQLDEVMPSE